MKKLPILFCTALFLLGFGGAAALGSSASAQRHEAHVAPLVGLDAQGAIAVLEDEGLLPDENETETADEPGETGTTTTTCHEEDENELGEDADDDGEADEVR